MANKLTITSAVACLFLMTGSASAGDTIDWLAPNRAPSCDDEEVERTVLEQWGCTLNQCQMLNFTSMEQVKNFSDSELHQHLQQSVIELEAKRFNMTPEKLSEDLAKQPSRAESVRLETQMIFDIIDNARKLNLKIENAYAEAYDQSIDRYACVAEISVDVERTKTVLAKGFAFGSPEKSIVMIAAELDHPGAMKMAEAQMRLKVQSLTSPGHLRFSVPSTRKGNLVLVPNRQDVFGLCNDPALAGILAGC